MSQGATALRTGRCGHGLGHPAAGTGAVADGAGRLDEGMLTLAAGQQKLRPIRARSRRPVTELTVPGRKVFRGSDVIPE